MVTGSARLDYYRKGGDSLVNRYRYFRLHLFWFLEYDTEAKASSLSDLLNYSGFPEPLFAKNQSEHRFWQRDRLSRVIKEDLRDLEQVKEISLIEALVDLLPSKVGSPSSIQSLREDLSVDHKTVSRWLTILENLYISFRVAPYASPKIRAVKKRTKIVSLGLIDNRERRSKILKSRCEPITEVLPLSRGYRRLQNGTSLSPGYRQT